MNLSPLVYFREGCPCFECGCTTTNTGHGVAGMGSHRSIESIMRIMGIRIMGRKLFAFN